MNEEAEQPKMTNVLVTVQFLFKTESPQAVYSTDLNLFATEFLDCNNLPVEGEPVSYETTDVEVLED